MTLAALALAWIAGILLGHLLWSAGITGCATPAWPFIVGAATALVALLARRQQPRARLAAVLALVSVLGAWRYTEHPVTPCLPSDSVAHLHIGTEAPHVTVEGVVISYPESSDGRSTLRLRSERVWYGETFRPVSGDILVRTAALPQRRYGDRLRVTGQLQTPPTYADFDYRAYLARQGILSEMLQARTDYVGAADVSPVFRHLYRFREKASLLLTRVLPEPSAALANGMLLGIESGIPRAVLDAYIATGTSHVIVISGSNIALLAGVLLLLLSRLIGRLRAVIPVILAIGLYVLLVGAGPAALRAGLMGALFVGAIGLGRQSTAWVSLAAAALLMTALDPTALWDAGFQISFAATLGLILFSPLVLAQAQRAFGERVAGEHAAPTWRALTGGVSATLAAQVLVIPVVLFHFGRFSVTSLLANALILPAQPPILTGGLLTLLAGLVWEPLGRLAASVPWLFLTYTTGVVEAFARLPFGVWEGGSQARAVACVYAIALLSGIGLWKGIESGWLALPPWRRLALLGAVALPAWLSVASTASRPDGNLHLTYLPAQSSEVILLTLPDAGRVLIAHTPISEAITAGQSYSVIIAPESPEKPATGPQRSAHNHLDPGRLAPGTTIRLADDVQLERLGTPDDWAFALRYGAFRTILPAALHETTQRALLGEESLRTVTFLKLPAADTGCWPVADFLSAFTPQITLWPSDTTYPPSVTAFLTERSLRVPGDVAVEVITDGKQVWLRQFTPPLAPLP